MEGVGVVVPGTWHVGVGVTQTRQPVGVAQPGTEGVSIVSSPGHPLWQSTLTSSPPCRAIADNVIYPGAPDLLAYLARGDGSGSIDDSSSGGGTAASSLRQYDAIVVPAQYEYDQVWMLTRMYGGMKPADPSSAPEPSHLKFVDPEPLPKP